MLVHQTRPLYPLLLLFVFVALGAFGMEPENQGVLRLTDAYTIETETSVPRGGDSPWHIETRTYPEFNATEWQLEVKGGGEFDVLEDTRSANFILTVPSATPVSLHWNRGSHAETTDFEPMKAILTPGTTLSLSSFGGRSSDGVMPYFNLCDGKGGLILAIGWTGGWKASFFAESANRIHFTAGLDKERLALPPGESLRLPSLLAMPYAGNRQAGQNQFRRLMLAHFTPANHPPMTLMPVAASVHGMVGFNDTTEANLCQIAGDIAAAKLQVDTFWLDAGWNEGGFPLGQGNPHPDPGRFPNGLGPVGAAANEKGMRFLVWFEPERAMVGTRLVQEHPAWLFTPRNTPPELRYHEKDGFRLLNLGHPDAFAWALETVSGTIRDAHIAIYRKDFNLYPAYFWDTGEAEELEALNQVRHINGVYRFLDGLVARFPELIIDNCASGGRRLDFEMMRRSAAYWHSDSCWDSKEYPRNVQAMTHGISDWLPLHGLGAAGTDTVALRSGMGACASYAIKFRDPAEVEMLRAHLDRYLPVRGLYAADYYPLTPWSTAPEQWLAFQFNDPQKRTGIVQAFCGDTQAKEEFTVRLFGLEPLQSYVLKNWDGMEPVVLTGAHLMEEGMVLKATRNPEAIVIVYSTP